MCVSEYVGVCTCAYVYVCVHECVSIQYVLQVCVTVYVCKYACVLLPNVCVKTR